MAHARQPLFSYNTVYYHNTPKWERGMKMSGIEEARGGYGGGYGGHGGLFTSTGVILVLFILLVIVSRSILY
ncbi:hypothetical protein POTG_02361 [Paenibacillus sp. oral taxon 786 str. D14]|nr:hypothetical protein POTG_02361 [Paenibacillus sp. oral taxon 786 str. D14]